MGESGLLAAFNVLALAAALWIIWTLLNPPKARPLLRAVAVLVLGDVGRSPRMMYHAESFAGHGFETYIIGYKGSKLIPTLRSMPHVHTLYLSPPPARISRLPFIIVALPKVIHQIYVILYAFLARIEHSPEFIIVQNPPSIPTLALVWFVSKLRGSKVIIDWHNLGYSILALKLGESHVLVRVAKRFEAYFGRSAYAHLFVTQAMRDFLVKEWALQGHKAVLYDRPPARFHRTAPSEMHSLFLRLAPSLTTPTLTSFLPPSSPPYSTPFTSVPKHGAYQPSDLPAADTFDLPMPVLRADRPALVVSSTSWTPDEDFGILLEALKLYEHQARAGGLPRILMVVTGKGPMREQYMREVEQLQNGRDKWKYVRCVSMWLEAEDYPVLLGSADLGISLHSSSSSLDLPMKVVDMFGCRLPVCALNFACLNELVKDGVNGLVFEDAKQLAAQLETLLASHPSSPALAALRASLESSTPSSISPAYASPTREHPPLVLAEGPSFEWGTWTQNWNRVMMPLILRDVHDAGQ